MLTAGEGVQARIRAVQLALPEIAPEGMSKLAQAADLQKYNPDCADEPRVPVGDPAGGQWTDSEGEADRTRGPNVRPPAAQTSTGVAGKERFVDPHLADAQKAADELGIPVENILGLSAIESGWGTSRVAVEGNNFFGIHYPAPYANGYIEAIRSSAKVATFASYADSLKSFIALSGSLVKGKSDPQAFAAALQNSGKFGIIPESLSS